MFKSMNSIVQDLNKFVSLNGIKTEVDKNRLIGYVYSKYLQPLVNAPSVPPQSENQKRFENILDERTNQQDIIAPTPDDVWIFGYGSLMWKADFPFIDRRRGYIRGYRRRFYQNSIDHRGTPERPGRVVTLLPGMAGSDRVYGVAYRIAAQQKDSVLGHLDDREKNGYERMVLQFQEFRPDTNNKNFDVIIYVATPENNSFAGRVWQMPLIAQQIFSSAGPSGTNREYLLNLAAIMRVLFPGAEDNHLYEMEHYVLDLMRTSEPKLLKSALMKELKEIVLSNEDKALDQVHLEGVTQGIEKLLSKCRVAGWREEMLAKELQMDKALNKVSG